MILCSNPRAQYLAHRTEIDAAIARVLDLPETEQVTHEVLSLPMYPELTESEVQKVIDVVRAFQGERND